MRAGTLPANHRYLGPVLWSTKTLLPDWWDHLPGDRPVIFITLGSSGRADLLPKALEALAGLPVTVIAATAGKKVPGSVPGNAFLTDYLPADSAIQRARAVICNGGSLTSYQAFASGVPVIGLCSNMDQLLNMDAVVRLGAGIMLRADRSSSAGIVCAANSILELEKFTQAARRAGQALAHYDTKARFRNAIADILAA